MVALKDNHIYMLGKFLKYVKATDTCLANYRHTDIYGINSQIYLNPLNIFFIFHLYNSLG